MKLSCCIALALVAVLAAGVHGKEIIQNFPYCACQEVPGAYYLEPTVVSKGDNTYCFKVKVMPPPGCKDYCCTKADLKKIEIDAKPACKVGGIKLSATINGKPSQTAPIVDRSFAGPPGTFVLKLTNIGLNMTTADGAEICYTLNPNGAGDGCTTLEEMCVTPPGYPAGVCQAALFDSKNDCCPNSKTGERPPSPPPPKVEPCEVCVDVKLMPPTPNPFPATFSPAECAKISAGIIADIKSYSDAKGAEISKAFTPSGCTATTVTVCGEFASKTDGAKLESSLNDILTDVLALVTPLDTCAPEYYGYTIVSSAYGDGCLEGDKALQCQPGTPDFPKCACNTKRFASPFAVEPKLTIPDIEAPAGTYIRCFHIKVVTPLLGSECADQDIAAKMEFYADETKRRKIVSFYIKPATRSDYYTISPSWGAIGDSTLKATPLNWNTTQADGAQVCFQMKNDTDLKDFCLGGACWSNIFNPDKTCCPLYASS